MRVGRHPKPRMGTEREVTARRVAAAVLDVIIIVVMSMAAALFVWPSVLEEGSLEESSLVYAAMSVIWFFYYFLLEGFAGQTIGKWALGIVVVKEDGSPCTFLSSFVRNLLRVVDIMPGLYLVGLVTMVLSKRKQRIGDHVAGTVVVRVG